MFTIDPKIELVSVVEDPGSNLYICGRTKALTHVFVNQPHQSL